MMSTLLPNEEREVDPAAQAKVAAILHGDKPQSDPYDALERCDKCEELKLDVKQTRYGKRCPECAPKRRSDAGVPRTQPSEQAPGVLTREQRDKLGKLIHERDQARIAWDAAVSACDEAEVAFRQADEWLDKHLDSLTGGA